MPEGSGFLMTLLAVRLVLLFGLGFAVDGRELSNDSDIMLTLANHPLAVLLGMEDAASDVSNQHPPLLGFLLAFAYKPASLLFQDFYALRLALIFYELVGGWFFYRILRLSIAGEGLQRLLLGAFILFPAGWMTTVVMAQDEVVAMAFITLVLWLALTGRHMAAITACSIGVVAGKIFLLVPLAAMVLIMPYRSIFYRAALAATPALAIYLLNTVASGMNQAQDSLLSFSPTFPFGVNAWVLVADHFQLNGTQSLRISAPMALVGGISPVLLLKLKQKQFEQPAEGFSEMLAPLFAAMLLWVFTLFYHVNPEYFIMVLPLLLLTFTKAAQLFAIAVLFSALWAVNFIDGVRQALLLGGDIGGKAVFVKLYQAVIPLEPATAFVLILLLAVVMTLFFAVASTRRSLQNHS